MSLKLISFIILFWASTFAEAKILEVKVLGSTTESFELKEVCTSLGVKDPLLVEVKDAHRLDCMGRIFAAADFCEQKFPHGPESKSPALVRSSIGTIVKRVYCERGESVLLRLACDQDHASYCLKPQQGCARLKKVFATNLEVSSASRAGKILRCYYSLNEMEEIPSPSISTPSHLRP